jgi:hypothetical protein
VFSILATKAAAKRKENRAVVECTMVQLDIPLEIYIQLAKTYTWSGHVDGDNQVVGPALISSWRG